MNALIQRLLGRRPPKDDAVDTLARSEALIARIRACNLTYVGRPKMENLRDAALRIGRERVRGSFIECGVALGGSAILLASTKPKGVLLALYDVFAQIPPPGPEDGEDAHKRYAEIRSGQSAGLGGEQYYGYRGDLTDEVRANLRSFGIETERDGVRLVKGLFEDTLHPDGPVALAHIDCDWYEPVKTCIDRILPHLSPGGILVFDDYSSYSGCTRAVDEMLAAHPEFERIFLSRSIGLRRPAA